MALPLVRVTMSSEEVEGVQRGEEEEEGEGEKGTTLLPPIAFTSTLSSGI